MKATSQFVENLHEVFSLFGRIEAKRMFGGYGIYHDGLMFGLVSDDVLYLKAEAETENLFIELGLPKFEYMRQGKKWHLGYYAAPEEIFDDPELAREWAHRAYGAALRGKRRARKPGARRG